MYNVSSIACNSKTLLLLLNIFFLLARLISTHSVRLTFLTLSLTISLIQKNYANIAKFKSFLKILY